jgi:protein TonB
MMLGVLLVLLLYGALLASAAIFEPFAEAPVTGEPDRTREWISYPEQPPDTEKEPPAIGPPGGVVLDPPDLRLPTPVDDVEIDDDFKIEDYDNLETTCKDPGGSDEMSSPPGSGPAGGWGGEYFPSPEEFVAFDVGPEMLRLEQPVYPAIARKAGIEGEVWVRILIDTEGNVRDAVVFIESGANAGFEEAAIKAALKGKWRPAMQNNHPVAVWAAYRVEFKLR